MEPVPEVASRTIVILIYLSSIVVEARIYKLVLVMLENVPWNN